jgi:lycopene cyclase CruP
MPKTALRITVFFHIYRLTRRGPDFSALPKHGAVDSGRVQTCIYVQVLMFNGESPLGLLHMPQTEHLLSTLPGNTLGNLRRVDELWHNVRSTSGISAVPPVVYESSEKIDAVDWDVVVAGGTLGIFIAATLVRRGWRVALIERGMLRGRDQEWNIARAEMNTFLEMDLLSLQELEDVIVTECNPVRLQFLDGPEVWVRDVLNLGIDPVLLLNLLKSRFLADGGKLLEKTAFEKAVVHPNGVTVYTDNGSLKTRLLLDAMGHLSPMVRQARKGQKPDGVCLVVGSCAQGFPKNEQADLMVSLTPTQQQCQYFWEAFPAREGRTTYLFTYVDAHPSRPRLEDLFEEYLNLLPRYQNVAVEKLQFQRALFGFFPSYQAGPLGSGWNRILAIGDSSGSQSPLSFGGFGAMVRHLKRLNNGIDEALQSDALERESLNWLQPYQPNLAVTWLFQRAMSIGVDQKTDPNQINKLLITVFREMEHLGEGVLRPFLQDVVQFSGLSQAMIRTAVADPLLIARIVEHVGPSTLIRWLGHYVNLGAYSALYPLGKSLESWIAVLPPTQRYKVHRWLDSWEYGSGRDLENH